MPAQTITVQQFVDQIKDAIAARPEVADFMMCVEGPSFALTHQLSPPVFGVTFGCAGFMAAADESIAYARIVPCELDTLRAHSTLEPKL